MDRGAGFGAQALYREAIAAYSRNTDCEIHQIHLFSAAKSPLILHISPLAPNHKLRHLPFRTLLVGDSTELARRGGKRIPGGQEGPSLPCYIISILVEEKYECKYFFISRHLLTVW
jgi:hypothetical protein